MARELDQIIGRCFMRGLVLSLTSLVAIGCTGNVDSQPTSNTPMSKFTAGQVWQYNTRPGEEKSRITVLKVESHPKLGTIVHISVDGAEIKSPTAPRGVSNVISHLPFSEDAVTKSVTVLDQNQSPIPDYQEGYDEWKKAVVAGRGGIWTIPIAEAVAAMEEALANSQ